MLSGDLTSVAVLNPTFPAVSSLVWGLTCRTARGVQMARFLVGVQREIFCLIASLSFCLEMLLQMYVGLNFVCLF